MKPAKLKRHLETKHASVKSKPVEFFQRCVEKMNKEIKVVCNVGSATKKALETSYITSLHIAKSGSPHSIGETLIPPVAHL
jgi:uroporphyrinogen-III synthase